MGLIVAGLLKSNPNNIASIIRIDLAKILKFLEYQRI
jgi:hypothetical protein